MKKILFATILAAIGCGAAELLPNGTFEQRFKDWRYPDWAGKPEPGEIVSDTVYGGNFAYRMGREGDKQNDLYIGFKPEPGKPVQVSFQWKAENLGENDAEVRILRSGKGPDGKSKVLGWADNPSGSGVNLLARTGGTHGWKEVKFVIDGKEFPENITQCMAERWRIRVGDKLLLHTQQRLTKLVDFKKGGGVELNKQASAYLPAEFTVSGIYSVGKYDFDRTFLFVGIDDAAELLGFPWGSATALYCWGPDPFNQQKLVEEVRASLKHLRVITWEESNRQLLGVLAVEKNMVERASPSIAFNITLPVKPSAINTSTTSSNASLASTFPAKRSILRSSSSLNDSLVRSLPLISSPPTESSPTRGNSS